MTFEELLDQALAMLQRRGRVTYHAVQRQFQLDDAALEDVRDELLYAHAQVHDNEGRGLIWTGDAVTAPPTVLPSASPQERAPLTYTLPIWSRRS